MKRMTNRAEIERLLNQTGRTLEGLPEFYQEDQQQKLYREVTEKRELWENRVLHQSDVIELLIGALRDALDKRTKWISVEELMPEHGTDVLVLTAPGTLSLGQNCVVAEYIHPRMEKSGVFINFYAGYDDKNILAVTHWMPLPELPNETRMKLSELFNVASD